jgi:L-2-hydroxycarboxylate dehydrogenase (NAD+)
LGGKFVAVNPCADEAIAALWGDAPRFPVALVRDQLECVYRGLGQPEGDAAVTADVLLAADLCGVESHGIALIDYHASLYRDGEAVPGAPLTAKRETPVSVAFDAHSGPGPVQGVRAMRRCLEKAAETGLCLATVSNSTHFGMAGYYARMASDAGLIGIAMTNSGSLAAPTFGARAMLGSNPIAVAVPAGPDSSGILLDMSTSTVAWGKVALAKRAGKPIPAGWALDETGQSTTDPTNAVMLTPLGGDRTTSGQKGYGLGLIVDVLCGPLGGGGFSWQVYGGLGQGRGGGVGHAFIAWRIDAFRDPAEFQADVRRMIADLHAVPVAPGAASDRVLVPGEIEAATRAYNERHGVPVRRAVLAEVRAVCGELGIPFLLDGTDRSLLTRNPQGRRNTNPPPHG